jgi:hypothetical protein
MKNNVDYIVIKKSKALISVIYGLYLLTIAVIWAISADFVEHLLIVYNSPDVVFGVACYSFVYGALVGILAFIFFTGYFYKTGDK